MTYRGKRLFDLAVALPLFVLTLPLQAAAALTILLTMGRPVFFAQDRPGLNGRPFKMLKFRTMLPVDTSRGWTSDRSRLTKIGSLLRATSIDELPSLWNIIQGQMSVVGPRPLLMSYVDLYSEQQARRMEVPPGLTGLAQISGRNAQTWEQRFSYDIEYVERNTFLLDVKILARTVAIVLKREGISADNHVTKEEFRGSDNGSK